MKTHRFECEQFLPRPVEEVFPFFADARNLQRITPSFLDFKVVTPGPIEMREGAIIDYRLRVRGVPIRWRTRINVWEPNRRFVDEQIKGPYRKWVHEHTFEPVEGGTLCRDRVDYAVPLDLLMHRPIVRPDIERIFAFRQRELARVFSADREEATEAAGAGA